MKFLDLVKARRPPIVVFGASALGEVAVRALALLGLEPAAFCDNDPGKRRAPFHGYPVIDFAALCRDYPGAAVVIAAGRHFDEIRRSLAECGFDRLFGDADLLGCLDLDALDYTRLKPILWRLAQLELLPESGRLPGGGSLLRRLNVVVTTRCTLNCRHCSSLVPFNPRKRDFAADGILRALDRLFGWVDAVAHVEVLGGEPFLYKDLARIVRYLAESGKVLRIDVVTNGTLLPPDEALLALRHEAVTVVVDDYGALSGRRDALVGALARLGLNCRVNRHWAWADLGGFEPRRRAPEELERVFRTCNFNACSELLDGRLYRCPRSSHGTALGLIPEYAGDFADLSDGADGAEAERRFRGLFAGKKFIRACDHCSGNTPETLTLPVAEQA